MRALCSDRAGVPPEGLVLGDGLALHRARGRGARRQGHEPRQGAASRRAGTRSATSSATTSRSARGSCARSASGRRSCGASRTGSRASRSTRSACPRSGPTGSRRRASRSPPGRHADELCVTELAQVAWAANLAVIDFHPWPSRRADTEHPDELRIDIDPQPGTDFARREGGRRDRARGARRDRLHRLAEDVGQPRHPRRLPDRAAAGSSRSCAGVRSRSRARSSGARRSS